MLQKLLLKELLKKTTEETGDLIGNKIVEKMTSTGKTKNIGKEEDNEVKKMQEIYIPAEKRQQIIDDLRLL